MPSFPIRLSPRRPGWDVYFGLKFVGSVEPTVRSVLNGGPICYVALCDIESRASIKKILPAKFKSIEEATFALLLFAHQKNDLK